MNEPSPNLPPMMSVGSGVESEQKLETDPEYRFEYVAKVIGFGMKERELISSHREAILPCLDRIVDRIYERMFEHLPMKKHFLTRHHGFYGHAPESLDEVTADQEQTLFRKMKLKQYFEQLSVLGPDNAFAKLLDMIGKIHTPLHGTPLVAIPLVQMSALLGFMCDQFMAEIAALADLTIETRFDLQRAYCKLFSIQNNMFLRHYNR